MDSRLEHRALLQPGRFYTREEVLARPSAVPEWPGVYAWYFDEVPPGIPTEGCHITEAGVLLYVGIAPKAPPRNGKPPSRQSLRSRIRYHYRGNAEGSTLRLTLGCHLTRKLDIALRRAGTGTRLTFTSPGEQRLSGWMAQHAFVVWAERERPWELEVELIQSLTLPLNLEHNARSAYYLALKELRAKQRRAARGLPPV